MKTTSSLLTLAVLLFTPNASAKPSSKNVVLITYQVVEDGAPVACDPTTQLDIDGTNRTIECNGGSDGFGGTFLVQLKSGKHSFRIWNVSETETKFDRSIAKRPSWFVQNVAIDVIDGVVTVTSSNL